MTEAELAEIEARMANFDHVDANYADETMRKLIAEVRRLRKLSGPMNDATKMLTDLNGQYVKLIAELTKIP